MKLNNKGMAISGILYSILILFLVLLFGILTLLASGKYTFDKLKGDIVKKLSNEIESSITDSSCFDFDYNTGTITGYKFTYPQCKREVVIPESIDYVPVKYIAAGAFYGGDQADYNKLTSIDFSNAVYLQEIYGGNAPSTGAFASNNISEVNMGTLLSLVSLGNYVFYENLMTSIDLTGIPNLNSIPTGMLYGNNITSINLSSLSKVTTIGDFAFYENTLSGNVDLSGLRSLTAIGYYAFAGNNISTVNTNNLSKLKTINVGAFHDNIIESFDFTNLPALDNIGQRAFSYNQLLSVNLSRNSNLVRISSAAFQRNQISSLTINAPKLAYLDSGAFQANLLTGTIDLTSSPLLSTIASYAFNYNSISRVRFNGTTIGADAFSYNSFTSVNFNSDMPNITTIGNYAFYYNTGINSVSFNSTPLSTIGDAAFYGASLTSISFPNTITSIGAYTFSKNSIAGTLNLSQVAGQLTLGKSCFSGNNITSLSLPTTLTSVGGGAFNNNQLPVDQANIYARNGDGSINTSVIVSYGGSDRGTITIPANVTTIGDYAYNGAGIAGVIFHSGITSIGAFAFSQSAFTTALDLSPMVNLVSIGNYAFAGQEYVSSWSANTYRDTINSTVYNNAPYTYSSASIGQSISVNGYVTASSVSIGSINFTGLTKLETIGVYAFYGIKAATINGFNSLTSLRTISEAAFRTCGLSGALDFSTLVNLSTIGPSAFYYTNITGTVNLGNTKLTAIDANVFAAQSNKTSSVTSLILPANLVSVGVSSFDYFRADSITFPNTLKTIGNYAFRSNNLTTLTIPSSVTSIGEYAFVSNKIAGTLDLSTAAFTTISANAFDSNKITSLILGTNIRTIGAYAFRGNLLTTITIPTTITSIGSYAFYGNKIAGSLNLSNANYSFIGSSAFENNQIATLVIGNNIKAIHDNAFKGNYITQLTLGTGVTDILGGAFENNRMSTVTIPSNVTSIGNTAFSQNIAYPWSGVTIEYNSTSKQNRFTSRWTDIGWPIELAPALNVEEVLVSNSGPNNFSYYGTYYKATISNAGYYKLEAWGAQGGNSANDKIGGKGSYASGTVYIEAGTILYVYVGGSGSFSSTVGYTLGGYNGGGKGYSTTAAYTAGSGGGATDFRLVSGNWNDQASLASRILIAAGGGGATFAENGYAGGALEGYAATGGATGGTQLAGGTAVSLTLNGTDGGFGYGGNGAADASAGGGAGYYGGAGGSQATSNNKGAPGGSSYISGYLNCIGVTSDTDLTPINPDLKALTIEDSYHYSGMIFIEPVLLDGKSSTMPSISGGTETGHSGYGYARITFIAENLSQ